MLWLLSKLLHLKTTRGLLEILGFFSKLKEAYLAAKIIPTYYTLTSVWFVLRYISDRRRLQWLRTPYHPPYLYTFAPLALISILIYLSFTKHNLIYGLEAELPIDTG